MTNSEQMIKQVRAALEQHPEVNLHEFPIDLFVNDGVLNLSGEVSDIAAKRIACQTAIGLLGPERVRDRLRLKQAKYLRDATIARALQRALMQELALQDCIKSVMVDGELLHQPDAGSIPRNEIIEALVNDGVVALEGVVDSLMLKRLAEVLCWWVPGVCEVNNRIRVRPDERDSDDEITDAVRIILERDPSLDAGQIKIHVRDSVVMLQGLVPGSAHRHLASRDVWYIPGVHSVENQLETRIPEI